MTHVPNAVLSLSPRENSILDTAPIWLNQNGVVSILVTSVNHLLIGLVDGPKDCDQDRNDAPSGGLH